MYMFKPGIKRILWNIFESSSFRILRRMCHYQAFQVVEKVLKSVMDSDVNNMVRLNDGFYKLVDHIFEHMEVTGEKIELRDSFDNFDSRATFAYGDFGGLSASK